MTGKKGRYKKGIEGSFIGNSHKPPKWRDVKSRAAKKDRRRGKREAQEE